MSRNLCLAVVFLAGTCFLAVSQPVLAAPGEDNGKRADGRQKLLQKFDKNGNGQLDPDEKEAAKAAMQSRPEQGGEKGRGGKGPGGKGGTDPDRRRKLLEKYDRDGDGKLSDTEKAAAKDAKAKRGG